MNLLQPVEPGGETITTVSNGWRGVVGYSILLALIFSTLTGLGPYRMVVGFGLIFVIYTVVTGQYVVRSMPRSHLLMYLALILLWLINQFYPAEIINHRAVKNILYALVVAATINALPRFESVSEQGRKKLIAAFVLVISAAVVGHSIVFFKEEAAAIAGRQIDRAFLFEGLFDNIHFLGLFCCFSLPVLLLGWVWFRSWSARIVTVVMIGLDVVLLLASSSRPAWLTIAVVTAVGLSLILPKKISWSVIPVFILAIWGLIKINLLGIGTRVLDFTNNVMEEERITLWPDTVIALRDSSFQEFLLGRGIGGYAYYSPSFTSDDELAFLVFPHNFFLEWLYEVGLLGFLMISLGLGYVITRNLLSQATDIKLRHSQIILGLTLMAVLLHGFFVLPFFYSRQVLFLVTILVCLSFVFTDKITSRVG